MKQEHKVSAELVKKLIDNNFQFSWNPEDVTVMELLDEMPKSIETDDLEYYLYYDFTDNKVYYTSDNCWSCEAEILMEYFGDTLSHALGKMYLWLKENNYLIK